MLLNYIYIATINYTYLKVLTNKKSTVIKKGLIFLGGNYTGLGNKG